VAYSLKADILVQLPETRLLQLTDDSIPPVAVNDVIVTAMIAKADNQINSYCRGKNNLPFNTANTPRVKDWSVSLTIWNLYKRRTDVEMPDPIDSDHDDVISELKGVRDGKIIVADPESIANTGGIYKSNGADTDDAGDLFTDKQDGTGTIDQYYNGPAV